MITGKIRKDIQSGYSGGSTDMYIPRLWRPPILKKIYAYDVNSLYPYVMTNNDYPIGDPTYIEYPGILVLNKETNIFGFLFANITTPFKPNAYPSARIP